MLCIPGIKWFLIYLCLQDCQMGGRWVFYGIIFVINLPYSLTCFIFKMSCIWHSLPCLLFYIVVGSLCFKTVACEILYHFHKDVKAFLYITRIPERCFIVKCVNKVLIRNCFWFWIWFPGFYGNFKKYFNIKTKILPFN